MEEVNNEVVEVGNVSIPRRSQRLGLATTTTYHIS